MKLKGIYLQSESKRFYPANELAGQNLVLWNIRARLEWGGTRVQRQPERCFGSGRAQPGARRRSFRSQRSHRSTAGDSLILTLDSTIQFAAEQALRNTIESTQAVNGSAIVMNPQNGEILAMASLSAVRSEPLHTDQSKNQRNLAMQDTYEPGSTFKVVTIAAVLNEGMADLSEESELPGGNPCVWPAKSTGRRLTATAVEVREVLAKSSNVGTIKLALRLGNQRLHDYIKRFGFGEPTGIDLPFEAKGRVRPTSEWSKISIGGPGNWPGG